MQTTQQDNGKRDNGKTISNLVEQTRRWNSFSFVELAGDVLDLWNSWRSSRNWSKLLLASPALLCVVSVACVVAIGRFADSRAKLTWYLEQADQTTKKASKEANPGTNPETSIEGEQDSMDAARVLQASDLADIAYQRILQLEKGNKSALHYVAVGMSRYGKQSAARQIMENLAPNQFIGFEPAHAWLAMDMIKRANMGQAVDRQILKHHLKNGTMRADAEPVLLAVYSQLLQADDQTSQAEQVINRAAKFEPALLLNSIAIYNRTGNLGQAKIAADTIVETLKNKFDGDRGDDNTIIAAQGYVQTNRIDQGAELIRQSLAKRPQSAKLLRAMSNVFRLKFKLSFNKLEGRVVVNLDFLNVAILADPTNLAIQEDLAILSVVSKEESEKLLEALRNQIATNGTSFAARLLIAEFEFRAGRVPIAVQQYEVLLAEIPNLTLALNNLAMMYTLIPSPKITEAIELIDRAIALSPTTAEFHDSRGDILVASNQKKEACDCYEKAIQLAPFRDATYEKLIKILQEFDETEKATKYSEQALLVKKKREEIQAAQQTPPIPKLQSEDAKE
jgi:tetratricopeptide (TPR) repeat protein